ncbi:MAG: DUF262 domain-containing protein [Bacteroidales bacterium]|nr:DUF262 domain-containing protein [Bacteroidales bacterium]
MKSNKIQQTTFWKFLQNRKIEIPIIQRDYAQGRIGKEKLRELFLKDLKNALDKNEPLKLDFIYGNVENNSLNPLDGQQRLTTLWLLHWYIAYKAGKLKENETTFKNFTYETRTSSREFCNKLSELSIEPKSENIVEIIQNQTWFFTEWKQDPTIQAMLTMLGGTSIKDNKANDIIDGLEEVFYGTNNEKYVEYWEKLSDESQCPIVFYHLDLLEMKLSDDLYIKMNARGKQLTDFENFKADLVGYIKTENIDVETKAKEKIAHKLDTNWTDIFWKNKFPNHKIDEIYYAFINRLLLNCLITNKVEKDKYIYTAEKLEKENKLFKYLYGDKSNDSNVKYHGFDIYKLEESVIKTGIDKLKTVLNRFELLKGDINKLFHPNWDDNSGFRFIPEYVKKDEKYIPTTLTQTQRVIFYAICCYFENGVYDGSNFKQWMRVIWNIVENANIETISAMIGAIRLVDDLAEHSNEIYNHLKDRDVLNDFAKEQMEEEKEKARQIANNMKVKDKNGKTWEEKIIEAENYAFFKGAIRFLFRTGKGEYDWGKFDDRFEKSKEYFDINGVKDVYKKDSILLRNLVSYFDKWNQFAPWDDFRTILFFDNEIYNWKNILAHVVFISPVNGVFDNDIHSFDPLQFNSLIKNKDSNKLISFQDEIVKTPILSKITTKCTFHWRNHGGLYSLYPYNTKSQSNIFVLAAERNKIISELEKDNIIEVENWQRIKDLPFYKGWDIIFSLKDDEEKYQWNRWNTLKKQNINGDWEVVTAKDGTEIALENLVNYLRSLQ